MFVAWGVGSMSCGYITYFITNWRDFILFIIMIPNIIFLFGLYFVAEPPRYLYLCNKIATINSLNYIAKFNGKNKIFIN